MVQKKETKPTSLRVAPRYIEAVGRRKTSTARVRIHPGKGQLTINDEEARGYFRTRRLLQAAQAPLEQLKLADKFDVSVKVQGGGLMSQVEAVRHGLARALTLADADLKKRLRNLGYLTRDSRMVERKKYGLKKARRAPQWQKR